MKTDKLIKVFKEFFDEREIKEDVETKIKTEDLKGYLDSANVVQIIPKTEEIKNLIESNFDINEGNTKDLTKFDFKLSDFNEAKQEIKSSYSMEYLSKIMKLCENYNMVKIKMKKDYPIWIETTDFICILAPRIESDENEN